MRVTRGSWLIMLAAVCLLVLGWVSATHRGAAVLPACVLPAQVRYKSIPAWSADGRRAVVLGRSGDRRLGLVLDTSSAEPSVLRCQILPDDLRVHPGLDSAGARLFYVAGSQKDPRIWSMAVASGRAEEIAHGVWPLPAPKGDGLAYLSLANEGPPVCNLRVARGSGVGRPVSPMLDFVSHAAWSPDGRRIAYVGQQWTADASAPGGYRDTGPAVGVALAEGADPKEVILASSRPTKASGLEWAKYGGLGWAGANTVVFAVLKEDASGRPTFTIDSYDLTTGTTREVLPVHQDQALTTYGHPYISDGARRVFWQVPPDDGGTYSVVDLATGSRAQMQFPEGVEPSLSPEGTRVLAVGRNTGALYLASLSAKDAQWHIEDLHPR